MALRQPKPSMWQHPGGMRHPTNPMLQHEMRIDRSSAVCFQSKDCMIELKNKDKQKCVVWESLFRKSWPWLTDCMSPSTPATGTLTPLLSSKEADPEHWWAFCFLRILRKMGVLQYRTEAEGSLHFSSQWRLSPCDFHEEKHAEGDRDPQSWVMRRRERR